MMQAALARRRLSELGRVAGGRPYSGARTNIALLNQSSAVTDADAQTMTTAVSQQVTGDVPAAVALYMSDHDTFDRQGAVRRRFLMSAEGPQAVWPIRSEPSGQTESSHHTRFGSRRRPVGGRASLRPRRW